MDILNHHSWNLGYKEAIDIQETLSKKLILKGDLYNIQKIAGVDSRYIKNTNSIVSVVIIFSFPELKIIEVKYCSLKVDFPYMPGFLAFREGPSIENCFKSLTNIPDVIFFDGHGFCHPRRFGLASHLGLILNLPSIGCAKSNLCGEYELPVLKRGNFAYIRERDEIIGAVLVTKDNVNPAFISVGHRMSLQTAIALTLEVSKYRIPEPIRRAHNFLKSLI